MIVCRTLFLNKFGLSSYLFYDYRCIRRYPFTRLCLTETVHRTIKVLGKYRPTINLSKNYMQCYHLYFTDIFESKKHFSEKSGNFTQKIFGRFLGEIHTVLHQPSPRVVPVQYRVQQHMHYTENSNFQIRRFRKKIGVKEIIDQEKWIICHRCGGNCNPGNKMA